MLGAREKAIRVADRGIAIIERAVARGGDRTDAGREASRCVAARALAVFSGGDEGAGLEQMRTAVGMSAGRDAVVMALARQLEEHLAARQSM